VREILTLCGLLAWGVLQAPAQYAGGADSTAGMSGTGQISIRTDVDSAIVFLDSARVGLTPLVIRDVRPGVHRLKIVHPDFTNWLTGNIVDSVRILPDEKKDLQYGFGRRYLILSVPSGADLMIGDSLVGSTPYLLTMSGADSLPAVKLRKPGYDTARVDLSEARRGIATAAMVRLPNAGVPEDQLEEEVPGQDHGTFRLYMAGAITVGFGVAAAYFKVQADERYDQYLSDFTSASRSQVRVYDTASALCLVVAEAGFGMLTYLLLAE